MKTDKLILFIQNINGIGDSTIRKMILNNCFKDFEPKKLDDILLFLKTHQKYFSKRFNAKQLTLDSLKTAKGKFLEIDEKCKIMGINYISCLNSLYPKRLKTDYKQQDFPVMLFYKGNIELLNNNKICAIIGTRQPSDKAKKICYELTEKISRNGYVIVSGLALGCDSIAHKACLDAEGRTIAIVGTGLDTIYPKSNEKLWDDIIANNGLIVSEYPTGFKGAAYSFVQRDRLQAALSNIVIPIQTSITGGTMHAAKDCVEKYNNELIVIAPSLVDDGNCTGNEYLIKKYFTKTISCLKDIDNML